LVDLAVQAGGVEGHWGYRERCGAGIVARAGWLVILVLNTSSKLVPEFTEEKHKHTHPS
jgi:hypothetical protein